MTEKKKTGHDDSADLRKRAEEALRESEERYRRLVETAPEAIYNLSAEDGTITFLNPAFERITGWSRADWLGKSFRLLVHPDDLTLAMETYQHVSRGEAIPPYELRILSKSGEYLTGEFTSFPHIEKGKVIGEFGIARDITERKKAEKEIQDLAKFPSENPNPVLRIARDGLLLYVNAAGLRQLAELHPQVGQAAPPRLREVVFRVMENGSAQGLDLEHRERVYSFFVSPVVDAGYANLYGLDITERKRAEEALRESEEKLRVLFDQLPIGVSLLDQNRKMIYANPAIEKILDISRDDLLKGKFQNRRYIRPDGTSMPPEEYASVRAFQEQQPVHDVEIGVITESGKTIWTSVSAAPFPVAGKGVVIATVDITERKRSADALRESEEKYRSLASTADSMYLVDRECRYIFMNEGHLSRFGLSWGEVIGRSYGEFHSEEDTRHFAENVERVFETGQSFQTEHKSRRDNKYFLRTFSPVVDSKGSAFAVTIVSKDITERKRAEEALQFMRISLDNAIDTMACIGRDGRFVDVNKAFCRIAGYSREELLSMTVHDIDPDYQAEIWSGFWERLKQAGSLKFESRHRTKDGRVFPVEIIATFFEYNGREYHCAFARDITERKRAEEILRKSEEKYRGLTENINLGIYRNTVGPEGTFIEANPAIIGMFGYKSKEEFLAINVSDLYQHPKDRNTFNDKLLKEGLIRGEELGLKKKDGSFFVGSVSAVAVKDEQGQGKYYDGIIEDITERKRAEEEIRKNNAELEAFVHMVSHDLKNPVVSIQGFCSLLMKNHKEDLNEKALFYIQRMQANAGLMTDLLEDLVELSRIGRIEDKKAEVSVQESIKSVWAGASTSLAAQNVEFVSPENLPRIFYSEKRLYQIFYNLLSNALKFRDEKRKTKVEIGHQEDKDHYTFFVRDNGIGIDLKYHHKIFESFSQLKDIKVEGTGMGLAIVKKIVEANQGKVWVESRKGAGSTFYFTVPKNVKF